MKEVAIQLTLFEDNDELTLLRRQVQMTFDRVENIRRGIFARYDELVKLHLAAVSRIEALELKTQEKKCSSI